MVIDNIKKLVSADLNNSPLFTNLPTNSCRFSLLGRRLKQSCYPAVKLTQVRRPSKFLRSASQQLEPLHVVLCAPVRALPVATLTGWLTLPEHLTQSLHELAWVLGIFQLLESMLNCVRTSGPNGSRR
jgi:hypothetical protein